MTLSYTFSSLGTVMVSLAIKVATWRQKDELDT
jgi:hypothetical protein